VNSCYRRLCKAVVDGPGTANTITPAPMGRTGECMAVPPFDHETALLACAQGDQHAFQDLYLQEAPRMLALGLKMLGERASAEDLVRDAFILIWKNAESFDPQTSSARAWMHSILR